MIKCLLWSDFEPNKNDHNHFETTPKLLFPPKKLPSMLCASSKSASRMNTFNHFKLIIKANKNLQ